MYRARRQPYAASAPSPSPSSSSSPAPPSCACRPPCLSALHCLPTRKNCLHGGLHAAQPVRAGQHIGLPGGRLCKGTGSGGAGRAWQASASSTTSVPLAARNVHVQAWKSSDGLGSNEPAHPVQLNPRSPCSTSTSCFECMGPATGRAVQEQGLRQGPGGGPGRTQARQKASVRCWQTPTA